MLNQNLTIPQEKIDALCQEYGVHELSLFGSALRTDFTAESDIDLLVEFDPTARIGLLQLSILRSKFESAFGRRVDLVPKKGLKPLVKESVLSSAIIIYGN